MTRRFWSARPVYKEIGGIQRVIAQEFEHGTVKLIRSTLRDDADLTARASSEFSSGDTCLNGELLHCVRDPEVAECRIGLGIDVQFVSQNTKREIMELDKSSSQIQNAQISN